MLKYITQWDGDKNLLHYQYIIVVLYLAIHLFSIFLFPLPWQDEIYNASITKSLKSRGEFLPEVVYYTTGLPNDIRYGPIYFSLTALSTTLLENDMLGFRTVSLLSGLLVLWIIFKILILSNYNRDIAKLIILLIAIDPFYFRCMHEGRMELTALFFYLLAFYFICLFSLLKKYRELLFCSLFLALSILTTPRVGFLWVGFIPYLFIVINKKHTTQRILVYLSCLLIPLCLLYYIWIQYAFGDIGNYITFYIQLSKGYTQLGGFYSFLQKNQYLLIPVAVVSMVYGIVKFRSLWFSRLHIAMLLGCVAFYLLVKDPGPYSVYIVPYFYIFLLSPWFPEDKRYSNTEHLKKC